MAPDKANPTTPQTAPFHRGFASFGSLLLLLALVAVASGVALLPFYSATADEAHWSVQAIQTSTPLRVLRAAHHWTSALLLLLGALYLLYGIFSGSYRRPRHLAWIAAVGLVLLFFLFQLTGHLLPWDSLAVSSAAIETGIAENAPVIGPLQARLLRGGDAVSPRTLTIWYTAHVALFPAALAGLAALFFFGLRRAGEQWRIPRGASLLALVALLLLALAVPAPLGPPAGPDDFRSFTAPPEWYVLPLHGLLSLAQRLHPSLAFIGTMVIPGLALLALLALPWLDRKRVGEPASHLVRSVATLGAAAAVALAAMNVGQMAPLFSPVEPPAVRVLSASPAAAEHALDPTLVARGKLLFEQNGCLGCHKVGGKGSSVGPPLDETGSRHPDLDWQIRHLKDPAALVPGSTMPPYNQLSDADLRALATYLLSLKKAGE